MRAAMEALLQRDERARCIERGLIQAKKFSWESFGRIAAETFSAAAGQTPKESFEEIATLGVRAGWESARTLVRNIKRYLRQKK